MTWREMKECQTLGDEFAKAIKGGNRSRRLRRQQPCGVEMERRLALTVYYVGETSDI
jgi:hypothetical protein